MFRKEPKSDTFLTIVISAVNTLECVTFFNSQTITNKHKADLFFFNQSGPVVYKG